MFNPFSPYMLGFLSLAVLLTTIQLLPFPGRFLSSENNYKPSDAAIDKRKFYIYSSFGIVDLHIRRELNLKNPPLVSSINYGAQKKKSLNQVKQESK